MNSIYPQLVLTIDIVVHTIAEERTRVRTGSRMYS